MFRNVVICEEDVINVVLEKAEKRVSYDGISWYLRVYNVIDEVSQKPRSL